MPPTTPRGFVRALLALLVAFSPAVLDAQDNTDSLRKVLLSSRMDTDRINTLNELASAYEDSEPDSAIAFGTEAARSAERLDHKAGLAEALTHIGYGHMTKEEYPLARSFYDRALVLWQAVGDQRHVALVHHYLGTVAERQSDFPEALKQYLVRMRYLESVRDSSGIANQKTFIGNIQNEMGHVDDAIKQQREALAIFEALRDTFGMAQVCNNLGTILDGQGASDEALGYLERALAMARKLGNPFGEAICLGSLSKHYERIKDHEQALNYSLEVLDRFERIGDPFHTAEACINTGVMLTGLGRYAEAKRYLEKGLALSVPIGAKQSITNAHAALYEVAKAEGDAVAALAHHELQIAYRDSISNEANTRKAVQAQMQYEFEKKEAATRAEQEKRDFRQRNIRNSLLLGLALMIAFAGVFLFQRNRIAHEKERSEQLLLNILPEEVAEELKDTGAAKARHFDMATILFTDFKGFTQLSEQVTPAELVEELNTCFKAFDALMEKYRIEKIKTIGDAYMAAGGLPDPQHGSPADVVRAALEMQDFMKRHKAECAAQGKPCFEMRAGIHTGPVVAGIVGVKKFQYDIWGDTVNTASRMESSGEVGQVNISEATYVLVKSEPGLTFISRGKVQAKGKGVMEMYFVQART